MKQRVTRLFAVDLGASGGKCFAGTFDNGSFEMREIHRFTHESVSFYLPGKDGRITERSHWNDTLLYRNIIEGLQTYRRDVSARLDGIGIDTWGADGHLVSEDGELLGKMYCYRDHRLDGMVNVVKSRIGARRVYELTGIHFQPFNISNQLCWFMMNRRDLLRPGARFMPVPTLFYFYLGGVTSVDSSWASVTQLMDAKRRCWSAEIMEALDIPAAIMPEIVQPATVVGKLTAPLAASLKLNRAPLIAVGSHDTASAFAAAPVKNTDDALIISSGTWSLVGRLVPDPVTTAEAMEFNISNEGGIGNTRLLKNCMGTWLVQQLRRVWRDRDGKEPPWSVLDPMTERAPAFTAFVDPDDPGFYNPSDMEEAILGYCRRTGQAVPPDRGTCLRVVYESLALKYRSVNEEISSVSGQKSAAVHIVGGGSRNILLNQFTADCLGLPVFAGPDEATAVGNIMVQALGTGILASLSDAIPLIMESFPITRYRPLDPGKWEEPFQRFRRIAGMKA